MASQTAVLVLIPAASASWVATVSGSFSWRQTPPGLLKGRQGGSNPQKQLLLAPALADSPTIHISSPLKQMFCLAAGQSGITLHGNRHWPGALGEVRLTLNFQFFTH